jgi:predicted DCC family thiol-disulfide oxidoreductase YuxK
VKEFSREERTILFVDGYCNLCNGLVRFLLKIDRNEILYFTPIDSNFSKTLLSSKNINFNSPESVYLLKNNTLYDKSMAIIEISKSLGYPYKLFSLSEFIPLKIRDQCYDFVARNRYKIFGKSNACKLSGDKKIPRNL